MKQAWTSPDACVTPGPASTRWLGFRCVWLEPGRHVLTDVGPAFEAGVVLVQGEVEVTRASQSYRLGPRPDPFDHPAALAFFPAGDTITVEVHGTRSMVAVAWAEGDASLKPYTVAGPDIVADERGAGPTGRTIRHLLEVDRTANRLYLVEVITPPGHWSSFPPHRHDRHAPPEEYAMEESYLFRIDPPEHRALMGTWSAEDDQAEAFAVSDGELVMVRENYHTVSAAPGSRVYYLNAMAGPARVWKPVFHPRYLHLLEGWTPPNGDGK